MTFLSDFSKIIQKHSNLYLDTNIVEFLLNRSIIIEIELLSNSIKLDDVIQAPHASTSSIKTLVAPCLCKGKNFTQI